MSDKGRKNNNFVYAFSVLIILIITAIAGLFPKAFGSRAQAIYNF